MFEPLSYARKFPASKRKLRNCQGRKSTSQYIHKHSRFIFFKEKIASRTLRDKVWKQQVDALRHWIAGKCALLLRNNEAHALMEVGAPVV